MMSQIKILSNLISEQLKYQVVKLILLMFFLMILEIFILQNLFIIINYFSSSEIKITNTIIENLKNFFKIKSIENTLFLLFLILFLSKNCLAILVSKFESKLITQIRADLAEYFFEGYIKMPIIFRLKSSTADLAKNITEEVDHVASTVHSLSILVLEILILIGISVYLLIFNFKVSLVTLFIFLIFGFFINIINRRKIIKIGKKRVFNIEQRLKVILEGLTSFKEIKLFDLIEKKIEDFKIYNNNLRKIFFTVGFRNSLPKPIFELFIVILIFCFFFLSKINKNEINAVLPILGVFLAASYRIIPSLSRILTNLQRFQFNSQSLSKIDYDRQLIDYNAKVNNKFSKKIIFEKNIKLKNVSFSYDSNDTREKKYIIEKINLEIKKGEKIGIIGESGSGKSTFLNIILGLYPISNGSIEINDEKVDTLDHNWHKNIACVPQDIFIYNDTLVNNIVLNAVYNEKNKEKLEKILSALNLTDLVNNLEQGVKTILGDNGVRLSGGQKQRIGIARAMFSESKILMLDEATSSLDFYNEKKILEFLNAFNKEQTVIFVSHNRNIFNSFDNIYEIRDKSLNKLK